MSELFQCQEGTIEDEQIQCHEGTMWIPLSERWPEKGQYVLVTLHDEYRVPYLDLCRFNGNEMQLAKIIAWCPCPEPYKEEE